jgi:hypothetical protein
MEMEMDTHRMHTRYLNVTNYSRYRDRFFLLNTFKNFFLKNLNLDYLYITFTFSTRLWMINHLWVYIPNGIYFFSMLFIWRRVDMRLILLYNLNLETKKTEQNILSDSSFYAWWYMITITAIAVLIESRILKRSEKFNRLHYWKLKNVSISRGKFLNII